MDIHVTLRHGPLEVDIDADSEDDYQGELLELLEFLEEYEERFTELEPDTGEAENEVSVDGVGAEGDDDDSSGQASMAAFTDDGSENEQDQTANQSESRETGGEDDPLASIARKADTSVAKLRELVDVDPTEEEPPFIVAETEDFGDTKTRSQFIGSLILLAVWDACHEEDRMKSSTLKDGLEFSEIDSSNLFNMYNLDDAEGLFDKTGRGGNTTIKLTRPGQREAYKKLRELLE